MYDRGLSHSAGPSFMRALKQTVVPVDKPLVPLRAAPRERLESINNDYWRMVALSNVQRRGFVGNDGRQNFLFERVTPPIPRSMAGDKPNVALLYNQVTLSG